MADNNWIQEVVGRVVSQVLQSQIPALRDELVRRVLEELQPELGETGCTPKQLLQSISAVRQANGQKEILGALLDGASQFSSRSALFVVRGNSVVGWQGRGFSHQEDIRNFLLETSTGLGARVLQDKVAVRGGAGDLDIRFTETFGAPQDNRVFLVPLLLKEKVAAVLYGDSGLEEGGLLDDAALEMLVLSSGLWLEIVALRRATASPENAEPIAPPAEKSEVAAEETASAHAVPEEIAPVAAVTAAPEMDGPAAPPVAEGFASPMAEARLAEPEAQPAPLAMAAAAAAGAAGTAAPPRSEPGAADDPVHRKAKRFAKLLVDEIKLYNQAKVQEGRKNRDLYQRLKDDIEKSRTAYEKRYGGTAAADAGYFDQEIVRNLAENDSSLLGAGFSR